jgi:hypothetical protein
MNDDANAILQLIRRGTASVPIRGKVGKRLLQPKIAQVLTAAGYDVDVEDTRGFFPPSLPAWRDKQSFEVVVTTGRRRIDLVVRRNEKVVALIETESDLNDLREHGVSGRSGHYDVFSIAGRADGTWFHSYKSLERMASAAWYATGRSPEALQQLRSDAQEAHNLKGICLILVTGSTRAIDCRILAPRLNALGASLISVAARN